MAYRIPAASIPAGMPWIAPPVAGMQGSASRRSGKIYIFLSRYITVSACRHHTFPLAIQVSFPSWRGEPGQPSTRNMTAIKKQAAGIPVLGQNRAPAHNNGPVLATLISLTLFIDGIFMDKCPISIWLFYCIVFLVRLFTGSFYSRVIV